MVVPAFFDDVPLITCNVKLGELLRSLTSIKCSDISTRNLALFDVFISYLLWWGLRPLLFIVVNCGFCRTLMP